MMPHDFSLNNYELLLQRALKEGYQFQTFAGYLAAPAPKAILMRHDVDGSIRDAYAMWRAERQLGVQATYFIRIHASGYNPFDKKNSAALKEMASSGSEIGLHQEVLRYTMGPQDGEEMLLREKQLLEAVAGCGIRGVSTHVPKGNRFVLTEDLLERCGFLYRAGADVFNRGGIFMSDSNRKWKPTSLGETIGRHVKIIALVHPFWWLNPGVEAGEIRRFLAGGF